MRTNSGAIIDMAAYRIARRIVAGVEAEVAVAHKVRCIDFDRLLISWENFSVNVSQGFRGTVHDYLAGLTHRDMLEEMVGLSRKEGNRLIVALISEPDERVRAFTGPATADWLDRYWRGPMAGWWWHVQPQDLGELATELNSS